MVDDWHSNQFVCRFSLAWLYISTGIMISVNSTLTIDRAIAIISPFSRLKFQVMISWFWQAAKSFACLHSLL